MRSLALQLLSLAVATTGCAAGLSTKDRLDATMRLTCTARSNAETTTVTANLTLMDANTTDPERIDLALMDRLAIRSGKYGAGLQRQKEVYDLHDGESTFTHAYEAAVPTGSKLELGFQRWEGDGTWGEIALPAPPDLALGGSNQSRITWTPSTGGGPAPEAIVIFVACDDGDVPKPIKDGEYARDQEITIPGVAARYKPPKDEGGIDVDALLSLATTRPAYNTPADFAKCQNLSVVVARSTTVAVPKLGFGAAQCFVESSRGIKLPPRAVPGAPPNETDAPPTLEIGQ